jgi:hypothetical protein
MAAVMKRRPRRPRPTRDDLVDWAVCAVAAACSGAGFWLYYQSVTGLVY